MDRSLRAARGAVAVSRPSRAGRVDVLGVPALIVVLADSAGALEVSAGGFAVVSLSSVVRAPCLAGRFCVLVGSVASDEMSVAFSELSLSSRELFGFWLLSVVWSSGAVVAVAV